MTMKLTKAAREAITSLVVLLIAIGLFIYTFFIPIKNEKYIQSARVFPNIVAGVLLILSILYVIASFRKIDTRISLDAFKGSFSAFIHSKDVHNIVLAIFLVLIYVLFGVKKGRFYISSAIFIAAIMLLYVRRLKPWISVLTALGFVGLAYLIFFKVFMVQLV